jgi:hypothetical protein
MPSKSLKSHLCITNIIECELQCDVPSQDHQCRIVRSQDGSIKKYKIISRSVEKAECTCAISTDHTIDVYRYKKSNKELYTNLAVIIGALSIIYTIHKVFDI